MLITEKNRDYSRPVSPHGITMLYGYSEDATNTGMGGVTGLWRAIAADPSGRLRVHLENVTFSGEISVDNRDLERLTSGISSGLFSIISTGNLPSLGDYTGVIGMGVAVDPNLFTPNYNTGESIPFVIDKNNGALLVNPSPLTKEIDSIVAWQSGSEAVSNTSPYGTDPSGTNIITGLALAANPNRIAWFSENMSMIAPLYIKYGTGIVNENNCNIVLNTANDYNEGGGSFSDQGTWRGPISVSGRGKIIIWEV